MNSLLEESIKNIIDNYTEFFFHKKNVIGVGIGFKTINEIDTKEPCLHVLVEEKKSLNKLYKKDIIPKFFLGIKTDVIKVGSLTYLNSNKPLPPPPIPPRPKIKGLLRPIKPGCSISPLGQNYFGTLGAIVFNNNDNIPYILSNNHVLSRNGKIPIRTPILQPGVFHGGNNPNNRIGELSKTLIINHMITKDIEKDFLNFGDCAIAKIDSKIEYSTYFNDIGTVNETMDEEIGVLVQKLGASTNKTGGEIITINAAVFFKDNNGFFKAYRNSIITTSMSSKGDSGSLLISFTKKAIGLLIGGNKEVDIFCPIKPILNFFNIHF
ncbi:hypothetical protein [Clostridium tarantellae]|uniref:Serine protease n=1 Tax=Clostridium tarantellae TaxID=39493 RepID=A0A6I1MTB2_9CLOT|nr:hypothetical protein [Clostridium tarantellae]MPQ44111.1 hypothetical protein [Clostridium tarantellae]